LNGEIEAQALEQDNLLASNPLNSDTEEDTVHSDCSPIRPDNLARVCPSVLITAAAHLSMNTASGMSLRGSLVANSSQNNGSHIQRPLTVISNMQHLSQLTEQQSKIK
jgi:hypothetical protein